MKTTTAIVRDHRGRAKKNGEGMLEIRVTHNRRHVYVSTGIKVRSSEWIAGRIVNRLDASALNERLITIYNKVCAEVDNAITEGRPIDAADIRERVWNVRVESSGEPDFLNWIEDQIPCLDVCDDTRQHYYTLLSRLKEWGKMRRWREVTSERIYEFDAWLHTLRKPISEAAMLAGVKPEKLSTAGIYNYHKRLKALLYRAERFGKIDSNPYTKLRGQFKKGEVENTEFLTEEEMTRIRTLLLPVGSPLDIARDLFTFQMFTGLAYSDSQRFDFKHYKFINGTWKYVGRRVKTGVPYVSELLPPVLEVLEKYNYTVPKIGNADYNHRLKEIGRMANIETRMHSHLARHTFATWVLFNDVKIENLRQMLGHKSIITTQRYAKVIAESVYADYGKVREKLK